MSGNHWYRRYPKDFIMGTLGMTLEEKGAYSILLDLIYEHGKPIVDEPRYISGVLGCTVKKWKLIRDRLQNLGKIKIYDGVISNLRAEKELETSSKLHQNFVDGGKKSAQKRGEFNKSNDITPSPPEATIPATLQHARPSSKTDIEIEENILPPKVPPPFNEIPYARSASTYRRPLRRVLETLPEKQRESKTCAASIPQNPQNRS